MFFVVEMALERRNQDPPPPPPSTPPRQSKRSKVQIARAIANATSSNTRDKDKDNVVVNPSSSPFSFALANLVVDEDEAKDSMLDLYSLLTLSTMFARSIGITTSLKRKKNQLRQIENRHIEKTKSYAITYDPRSVAAKKRLFDFVARDSLDDVARKREYKTNKKKKEVRIRVKIRLEKKQLL
jgi:hypothetical protein